MKRLILFILLASIALVVSKVGFVEISVQENSEEYSYTIDNHKTQISSGKSSGKTIKKLLWAGNYTMSISSNDKNGIALFEVKGFLQKSKHEVSLKKELGREFVGNNPGACTHYSGRVLLSFQCGGSAASATIHIPATAKQGTYTSVNPHGMLGNIYAVIKTKEGIFAVMESVEEEAEEFEGQEPHVHAGENERQLALVQLDGNYQPSTTRNITIDKKLENIRVRSYDNGFVVYDNTLRDLYYFDSVKSPPKHVGVEHPADKNLFALDASVNSKGDVSVLFTDYLEENSDDGKESHRNIKNTIVVTDKSGKKTIKTGGRLVYDAQTCGTEMLCVLKEGTLEVSAIKGISLTNLYDISDVVAIKLVSNDEILVVRKEEVVRLNASKRQASVDYKFRGFGFCGIKHADSQGYVLCIKNSRDKSAALYITNNSASDGIDQKTDLLFNSPEISNVSVYKNFISITPNYSLARFSKDSDYSAFNSGLRSKIENAINSSGIDRQKYNISILL